MCEGDDLNSAFALLWAGNQGERAGVDTVPVSAGCVLVCVNWKRRFLPHIEVCCLPHTPLSVWV